MELITNILKGLIITLTTLGVIEIFHIRANFYKKSFKNGLKSYINSFKINK